MVKVRATIVGEARQVHEEGGESHCNCHELIKWIGTVAYLVGAGIEIDGQQATPGDWIIKLDDEIRVVTAQNFAKYYEIVKE